MGLIGFSDWPGEMKLPLFCISASLAIGPDFSPNWGARKPGRWAARIQKLQKKQYVKEQKAVAGLARSLGTVTYGWSPCEGNNGKIRANPPKRKLTKMELCMRKSGIGFAGMKCLNWKNMATHADSKCRAECNAELASYSSIVMVSQRCANGIPTEPVLQAAKNEAPKPNSKPEMQRGNGKKGKKGKKGKGKKSKV